MSHVKICFSFRHEEADKSDSGDDSDVQDIIVVESTRVIVEADRNERDFWADSESDSEFELSNYDAEVGPKASDTWVCQKCHIKNPPMVSALDVHSVIFLVFNSNCK